MTRDHWTIPTGKTIPRKKMKRAAIYCRVRAAQLFQRAQQASQPVLDEAPGAEETILTDVLRRAGKLTDARAMCIKGLDRQPVDLIQHVLEFEMNLIDSSDVNTHTVDETGCGS